MLLAELEVRHSRPIAPTRRVALGRLWLPTDPAPGFGGVLLAGIVAAGVADFDEDTCYELDRLVDDLDAGRRISQPRLRHRFQTDVVGLDRSCHQLVGAGEAVELELDMHGSPLPQVLGAVYAAGQLSLRSRSNVFRLVRRAARWRGPVGERLVTYLTGDEAAYKAWRAPADDQRWALETLGFVSGDEPEGDDVLRRFRQLVRSAHPDAGGSAEGAGQRISDLTEAKRILRAAEA